MILNEIFLRLRSIFFNIFTMISNFFIRRDNHIWLFGAWMGGSFSDNSRFLFQFLHENKSRYDIKKVIWVTRSLTVYKTLKDMGYEVYLMHCLKSYYYHLKAGIHVICNISTTGKLFKGDIMGDLSWNANKIQLWHGVGIKACGGLRNHCLAKPHFLKQILKRMKIFQKPSLGGWNKFLLLVTSEENKRVAQYDFKHDAKDIIMALYPRLCPCVRLTREEKYWVCKLEGLKKQGKKIILYLPTFREVSKEFLIPSQITGFEQFLSTHGIIWLEKKHRADHSVDLGNSQQCLQLPQLFDVNVLYPYIDMLITDYSSAASDAIFWNKLTVEYCPDYNTYKDKDRGFVAPWAQYHVCRTPVVDPNQLFGQILEQLNNSDKCQQRRLEVKQFLFGSHLQSYEDILKQIYKKIDVRYPSHFM